MKTRVLIVDDEESIRKLLKSRMEREGYDTLVAADAEEAEKLFGTTGNGIGTAAARTMRIVVVLVSFVHADNRSEHFSAAEGERGLAVDTTQIHR